MNINFDPSITSQSRVFFEETKIKASDKLIEWSEEHPTLARFSGLPIGICSGLLELAAKVTTIGETALKAVVNIFGSIGSDQYSYKRGLKQLFVQLPLHLLDLALSPLEFAAGTLGTTIWMGVSPESYLTIRKDNAERMLETIDAFSNDKPITLMTTNGIEGTLLKIQVSIWRALYSR